MSKVIVEGCLGFGTYRRIQKKIQVFNLEGEKKEAMDMGDRHILGN